MDPDYEGAQPSVVAELVAYLIKPEAHFVNGEYALFFLSLQCGLTVVHAGQVINIDGGLLFD